MAERDDLPPWAQLEGDDDGLEPWSAAEQVRAVEAALRWRLVLGRHGEEQLARDDLQPAQDKDGEGEGGAKGGDLAERMQDAERMEIALDYVYDRAHAQRAHHIAGSGEHGGLTVPAWLSGVRQLFPVEAVRIIERDALTRFGMTELVTDADALRHAERSEHLVKAILQFKHLMGGEVLEAAREVVEEVVGELADKLQLECGPALHGPVDPERGRPQRTFRNADWNRTVRRNLDNYDVEEERIVVDRVYYRHRQRSRSPWRVVVAVDQSGSMTDSLIHSAVMAAIFARLPSVTCNLVLWDHRVVDVSEWVSDPIEVLMSCQLGGGTQLLPALQYCGTLVTEPERTILVVVSDFYMWDGADEVLPVAGELAESGALCIGLCALDADGKAVHDEAFARRLAGAGWFVASMTPKALAEHIGKVIAR